MIYDILCSVPDILLTMGLPAIDESLQKLLEAMRDFPKTLFMGQMISIAKAVGCCLAMCVGAYESWMMMLGRRAMDVMKLFRVLGISICIMFSGQICSALAAPGFALEDGAKGMAVAANSRVAAKEKAVAQLQDKYLQRVKVLQDSIENAKKAAELGEDASWYEEITYTVKNLGSSINNWAQRSAVLVETKASEWVNNIIRFLGELIFQMSYWGMFCANRAILAILGMFCPLAFALSLAPPWKSAWSQWISKYLSISLWGMIIYIFIYYVDFILLYDLELDMKAYQKLLGSAYATQITEATNWSTIGALGIQGIGSACMYAMGMLVGAFMMKFVPEVASWLIPGGASSSMGSAMAGASMGIVQNATSYAAGKTVGAATSVGAAAVGTPAAAAAVAGSVKQSKSDGGSVVGGLFAQTTIGQSFSGGANNARSYHNVGKNDSNYSPGGTSVGSGGGGSHTNTSDRNYDYDE